MHTRISVGSGQACLPGTPARVGGWLGAPARRATRRGTQAVPGGTARWGGPGWSPPAAGLALFHEALSKLLELATVLRLAGLFLDLLGELLPLRALGEVLGPLEQ